jgi:uncharacterized protein YdiU (UPF0061 family)
MAQGASYRPERAVLTLDQRFHAEVEPADFPMTTLRWRNQRWAEKVGLGHLSENQWLNHFGRFAPLQGSLEKPLALAYHGHQFGVYNPDLGDGRGFLFAQLRDGQDRLLDLGTKGSGQTPWSRSGDGRLTLKGGVREILASHMLEALGVYTSKAFSVIETGEQLHRGDEPSPTRSCVLVRLSHSHVRFGTFQRFAHLEDADAIGKLVEYCVAYLYPEARGASIAESAAGLMEAVVDATADLAASWMAAGFVHGVLNTDNMVVTGESFDYGPWRFLPTADPNFTAAYFDHQGLYRFGRQPRTAAWNLSQLGSALTLVCEAGPLQSALDRFETVYPAAFRRRMFAMLGLHTGEAEDDTHLFQALFAWMAETKASWPQVFFDWFGGAASEGRARQSPIANPYNAEDFRKVRVGLLSRAPDRPERLRDPYFARDKPARLLIEDVEALWAPIAGSDDWGLFDTAVADIDAARRAFNWQGDPSVGEP